MVAENDEQLMEKYFEKGELSPEELIEGLRKSILNRQVFPIFLPPAITTGTFPQASTTSLKFLQ
ncbi:hypothetical protein ES705_44915 [subsurface metagenome]